jgi:hypothetical protein
MTSRTSVDTLTIQAVPQNYSSNTFIAISQFLYFIAYTEVQPGLDEIWAYAFATICR